MTFQYLGSFKKGEPVPDWLLSADPLTPSPPIRFGFIADCHAVRTGGGIYVLADIAGEEQIKVALPNKQFDLTALCRERNMDMDNDGENFTVSAIAPNGTVIVPFFFGFWGKRGDGGESEPVSPEPPNAKVKA